MSAVKKEGIDCLLNMRLSPGHNLIAVIAQYATGMDVADALRS